MASEAPRSASTAASCAAASSREFVASATPTEVPALQAWFEDELLALPQAQAPWLEHAVEAFERQLGLEQRMPAEGHGTDGDAGKLAVARALAPGTDAAEAAGMQRIVSERLEARLAKRWGARHVQSRVAQVSEIEAQVADARANLAAGHAALEGRLAARLWIAPARALRWLHRFHGTGAMLEQFALRLAAARAGFAALPVDAAAADEPAPPPVPLEPAGVEAVAA